MELRAKGVEVTVGAPNARDEKAVLRRLGEIKVCTENVPMSRTGISPIADLRTLISLVVTFRRLRPTIFLGYTIKPVIWGMLAAWLAGVPRRYALITGLGYTFSEAGGPAQRSVRWLARQLYRLALANGGEVIFQNADDAELFSRLGLVSKNAVIHVVDGSGVDLELFPPLPFPPADVPVTFVLIARLLKAKGIREYAAAAAVVKSQHPKVRCLLVGGVDADNPDAIELRALAEWQASGTIEWLGQLVDISEALKQSHVFVLPSYREGTPRSALEAMASGRPLIMADTPGCRETVIEGENGFKVRKGEVSSLAKAMQTFAERPHLIPQMGLVSLAIARNRYDVNKINRDMLNILRLT